MIALGYALGLWIGLVVWYVATDPGGRISRWLHPPRAATPEERAAATRPSVRPRLLPADLRW